MFGINKKKLIIVCDKNTEMHANYLYQLISSSVEREIIGIEDGKIDAIAGATLTGNGVQAMISDGIEPYISYIKSLNQ